MAWELEETVRYYQNMGAPQDQTALVNLLKEIQQENGGAIPTGQTAPNGRHWLLLWKKLTGNPPRPSRSRRFPVCACAAKAPISNGTDSSITKRTSS